MLAKVTIMPKEGVLDPQGKVVERSLHTLGHPGVTDVRVGKVIEFSIEAPSSTEAESQIRQMCERLLANPVIEDYRLEILDS